jgi:hypothetical protein
MTDVLNEDYLYRGEISPNILFLCMAILLIPEQCIWSRLLKQTLQNSYIGDCKS